MSFINIPEHCVRQWQILLALLTSEERRIDNTFDNEVDAMNYFYWNEGIRNVLLQWLQKMKTNYATKTCATDTALKCDEVSLRWRQEGNEKFRANKVAESYKCYLQSVLFADQKGPMYPLALANRSAALLKMKEFKKSLADVAMAMENGYPAEQRHKLLFRKADCYIEMNLKKEAKEALAEAIHYAKTLNLPESHTLEIERHVKILERKLGALKEGANNEDDVILPDCYLGSNPNLNAASNALELQRSDTAGRFVVAKRNLKRGDVVFSEEPYAWVTLPSEIPVCEMCCEENISLIPCETCSRSIYCGLECRAKAEAAFHRWECVGAQSKIFHTIGIAHLGMRILLIAAHNKFPALPNPVSNAVITAADVFKNYSSVDNIEIYKTNSPAFLRMFNLVNNFDKMYCGDYIQYALTATMLTLYLEKYTTFFEYLPSRLPFVLDNRQMKLFAASLILRSIGQMICNGHATLSLYARLNDDGKNAPTLTEREERRATAIYPSAAMMNHSCDPNIVNTFYKKRLIIRCGRELEAGTELVNCYGPHRARDPAEKRRHRLRSQYAFTCMCAWCTDAERRDFALLFSAYACQSCKGPVQWAGPRAHCQQCRAEFVVERALSIMERSEELAEQAEQAATVEERCEKLLAAFRMKQQVLHRHHTSLRAAADRLSRIYAELGEFGKSMELIKQNIQSLEYQFGSFSVEVAHDLRKLADVMVERILTSPQSADYRDWCLEAYKIIKKAVQLIELNYGPWESIMGRLRTQEAIVASALARSSADAATDSVHHSLHYNLKI